MAGRGPIPKPAGRKAGHTKAPVTTTIIPHTLAAQPDLPARMPNGKPWPPITRSWWRMWGRSALSSGFTENDWAELRDTAVLHGEFWTGRLGVAAELRLRVANFGATPSDRARLRIQFAQADEADAKRPTVPASKERRGTLHALPSASSE